MLLKGVAESRFHVLGRACHLVIADPEGRERALLQDAIGELRRIESRLGTRTPGSFVYRLNHSSGPHDFVPIDAEASQLLAYVDALRARTNGIFDPSTSPLDELWSETAGGVPSEEKLQECLQHVGWSYLARSAEAASLTRPGMRLNLDPSVCPYAVDRVRRLLLDRGVQSALIDLDRDVATIGRQADGANWLLGLRYPRGARTAIHRLKLSNACYSLRGNFEHRLVFEGEPCGRSYSPVDGCPVPGPLAVAVIANSCLEACAAATVGRHTTEDESLAWLSGLELKWLAIDRSLRCHGPLAESGGLLSSP